MTQNSKGEVVTSITGSIRDLFKKSESLETQVKSLSDRVFELVQLVEKAVPSDNATLEDRINTIEAVLWGKDEPSSN